MRIAATTLLLGLAACVNPEAVEEAGYEGPVGFQGINLGMERGEVEAVVQQAGNQLQCSNDDGAPDRWPGLTLEERNIGMFACRLINDVQITPSADGEVEIEFYNGGVLAIRVHTEGQAMSPLVDALTDRYGPPVFGEDPSDAIYFLREQRQQVWLHIQGFDELYIRVIDLESAARAREAEGEHEDNAARI